MKRKISILFTAVLAIAFVFGACAKQQATDEATPGATPSPVVSGADVKIAEMDGQPIYLNEFASYMTMLGDDISNYEDMADVLNSYLDQFMEYKVTLVEYQNRGYLEFTDEELSQMEEEIDATISYYESYYGEGYFDSIGITRDDMLNDYKYYLASNKAAEDETLLDIAEPSEEDIKAQYDSNVAADQESILADPVGYIDNAMSGITSYYVPAGVRMVKSILIPFDDDTASAIASLRGTYDAQADMLRNAALENADYTAKADGIYNQLVLDPTLFESLAEENPDTNMPEGGYSVIIGSDADLSDYYSEEFIQAAAAFTTAGEVSALIPSDSGYMIIQFSADLTEGPADYDSTKNVIIDGLKSDMASDAQIALIAKWKLDHGVVCYYDNL